MAGCSIRRILVLFDWLVGVFSSLPCPRVCSLVLGSRHVGLQKRTSALRVCVAHAPVSNSMCATFLRRGLDWHFPCTFQTGHFWWPAPCQDSWCLAGVLKFIRQYYGQSCAGNNHQKKTILCKKKKYSHQLLREKCSWMLSCLVFKG